MLILTKFLADCTQTTTALVVGPQSIVLNIQRPLPCNRVTQTAYYFIFGTAGPAYQFVAGSLDTAGFRSDEGLNLTASCLSNSTDVCQQVLTQFQAGQTPSLLVNILTENTSLAASSKIVVDSVTQVNLTQNGATLTFTLAGAKAKTSQVNASCLICQSLSNANTGDMNITDIPQQLNAIPTGNAIITLNCPACSSMAVYECTLQIDNWTYPNLISQAVADQAQSTNNMMQYVSYAMGGLGVASLIGSIIGIILNRKKKKDQYKQPIKVDRKMVSKAHTLINTGNQSTLFTEGNITSRQGARAVQAVE